MARASFLTYEVREVWGSTKQQMNMGNFHGIWDIKISTKMGSYAIMIWDNGIMGYDSGKYA